MLTVFAIGTALTLLVIAGGGLWMWMSRAWQVMDDDEAVHRLHREAGLRGWFRRAPRLLTYRRDRQGRFRQHKR